MTRVKFENRYLEADSLSDAGKHEEAFKHFSDMADAGDSSSMSRLAILYAEGLGVEKDLAESIRWDLRAIEAGDTASMNNLALTYCSIREFRKARYWFERAIATGDGDAALELARLLYVSDKELDEVRKLIAFVIECKHATLGAKEEAVKFASLLK
jgi:uncharacterized protein